MPTYVCSVPRGSLTSAQKQEIANAISRDHSEATGAPKFFVQVVIEEDESAAPYLGGTLTNDHIWIRGDIRAGRTVERRKSLIDMIEYGHVLPEPGKEKEWFEALPESLKVYLAKRGTNGENFTL